MQLLCCARWIQLFSLWKKSCGNGVTIQWNLLSSTFLWHVVLLTMLFKAVLTLESEDETLSFDQSNKSYCAEQYVAVVLLIMLYKVVLTFESEDEILKCIHSNKGTNQYFPVVLFTMPYKAVLTFECVYEILKCDHSTENYWGAQYFSVVLFIHSVHSWNQKTIQTIQTLARPYWLSQVISDGSSTVRMGK